MNLEHKILSPEAIGQRVSHIRRQKGFSQEELAKLLDMSRPSLAQLEVGKRGLDVRELQRLSLLLEFSVDEFLGDDFETRTLTFSQDASVPDSEGEEELPERNPTPALNAQKFKAVLHYIIEQTAGKPNVGETVLNKLMYFADFNHFEIYEEHLTGAAYRKLPFGPVPSAMSQMLSQMETEKKIQRVSTEYYGKPQTRFLPLSTPDLGSLSANEKNVIDSVLRQMSDWSATAISEYSHLDKPWKASELMSDIDYELVFYRRPPFSVRTYQDDVCTSRRTAVSLHKYE